MAVGQYTELQQTMSKLTGRIQRLEKEMYAGGKVDNILWAENEEDLEKKIAEAEQLRAQGYKVMVAHWIFSERRAESSTGESKPFGSPLSDTAPKMGGVKNQLPWCVS